MGGKLSILQVSHGFPPREQAGAELCCFFLSRELLRRGHRVEVLARGNDPSRPRAALEAGEYDGIPVTRIYTDPARARSMKDTWLDPSVRGAFEKVLEGGFDIVHFHHLYGLSLDLVEAAKAAGAGVVMTLHDFWFLCPRGQRFTPGGRFCEEILPSRCSRCMAKKRARWAWNALASALREGAWKRPHRALPAGLAYLARNLYTRPLLERTRACLDALNQADLSLSPSKFLLEEYRAHGLSPRKSAWSENGLDFPWVRDLQPREKPHTPFRFGFIGSFLHSKGVEVLLQAFQGLSSGRAELHLHGTSPWDGGAYAASLEKKYARPGLFFHGPFPHEEIPRVLSSIDVLAVPSLWYENAPLTLDEAALAEIPVVASDMGGMREITLRRKNGLLFPPGDPAALRSTLKRFLDEKGLWNSLRRPAHPVRSAADQAEELETRYAGILEKRKSP